MNLLLLEPEEIDAASRARLRGRRAEHIRSVLRAEAGQTLRVGVVGGGLGQGRVIQVDREAVELEIAIEAATPEMTTPQTTTPKTATPQTVSWVDLIVGLPRPAVLHRVLQTVAVMGVGRLDLTASWRVEKSYFSSPVLRPESIRKHLLLGAEQGMTTRLPQVVQHRKLVPLLHELEVDPDPPQRLLAHPDAAEPIEAVWTPAPGRRLEIAIGPEGGWIDREVDSFLAAGFVACSLGPWILRVENAVTAALAQADLVRRRAAGESAGAPC
ncbi:MAG: RsmE family RNA methyltransferase [Acidobacteriota bacterium]